MKSSENNYVFKCNLINQGGLVFAFVSLFFGLLVCQQDFTKTTEWISTKLRCRMSLSPERTPLTFILDTDNVQIQDLFSKIFFDIFTHFAGNNDVTSIYK